MLRLLRFLMICRYVECLDTLFWKGLVRCQMMIPFQLRCWRSTFGVGGLGGLQGCFWYLSCGRSAFRVGFPMVFPWFFHGFSMVFPGLFLHQLWHHLVSHARQKPGEILLGAGENRRGIPEFQLGKYHEIHEKPCKNMQKTCAFSIAKGFTNHRIVGSKILRIAKDHGDDWSHWFPEYVWIRQRLASNMKQGNAEVFGLKKNVAALPALNCLS